MTKDKQDQQTDKQSKRWLSRNVLGTGLTSLFSDMGHEMVTSLLPAILTSLGAPPLALGLVEGLSDLASSTLKFWGGWFTDRPAGRAYRKPIVVVGYLATAFKALIAFAVTWPQVLLIRIIGWAGRGVRSPLRDAILTDSVTPQTYGRAFGFHRAMDTLGAVIGPLLVVLLLPHLGEARVVLVSVIPGLLSVLVFGALVTDRPTGVDHGHSFWQAAGHLPRRFLVFVASVGVFGLGNFAHTFLILRATEALTPRIGATAATATAIALYTLHNVLYAAGSFPVGVLADRIGKRGLLAIGYGLFALMAVGFAELPLTLGNLIPLFILAGLYIGIVDTVEGSLAAELLPEDSRGAGFGLLGAVNGVGDVVSSVLVGFVWTRWSPGAAFWLAAAITSLGALVLYGTRPRPRTA